MITRRIFLKDGGLALVSLGFAPAFVARAVATTNGSGKTLITIFQRGAVDGLNMIVPFGERDYYAARPTLAIAPPRNTGWVILRSSDLLTKLENWVGVGAPVNALGCSNPARLNPACPVKFTTGRQFDNACGTLSSVARNSARWANSCGLLL